MNKTGFGFLRLPKTAEGGIDYTVVNAMVDRFLELGGSYFDTAYTYLDGLSEEALRKSLVERYPRERFLLSNKLPGYQAKSYADCEKMFREQLERCGTDYFDVYMLHFLNEKHYALAEQYDEFRFLRELKQRGLARRIGFSFHDTPELLDKILSAHPEVDVVLLQINYLDWDSVSIQSKKQYEVAVSHGKTVLVMEPVRGGTLVKVPEAAEQRLRSVDPDRSMPSWAIRFATELPQVEVVLSGMNAVSQVEDNLKDFAPMTDREKQALADCADIIRSDTAISCTGCGYCVPGCPQNIPIPDYFALYNDYKRDERLLWKMRPGYQTLLQTHARASDCIGCGKCEKSCPQKLSVREHLEMVAKTFEEQKTAE